MNLPQKRAEKCLSFLLILYNYSTTGSKKSMNEEEDRVSRTSKMSSSREFRTSMYVEPSNEQGTVI